MPQTRPAQPRPIGYALNVFACDTLAGLWRCLQNEVLEIKARAFLDESFPLELRFSERLLAELDCDQIARLKHFLDTHDLLPLTGNAFVMPAFHGGPLKERVYLPGWHESEARLRFTIACAELLAQLAPADAELISLSVPFGALKPVPMEAVAPNILKAAEHAARCGCVLALEPEPGLCVETTAEAVEFFERFVPQRLRQHLGVCFDLAHQLVQFESLGESVRQLLNAGVRIAKVHVSNAAELTELRPFYRDSIYLHQVTGADAAGRRVYFSLDWPHAAAPPGIARYRCHYHLPVCSAEHSTLPEVAEFLSFVVPVLDRSVPLIIETYTHRQRLVDNICREIQWVRKKISLSAPQVPI